MMRLLSHIALLAIVFGIPALLLAAVIGGAGPVQYDPMDPDTERAWLRTHGLTEEQIDDIQTPIRSPMCRCEPRRGYGTSCCPIHRSGEP